MALYRNIILRNKKLITNQKRYNGYIVLVPEIGEDLPEKNPLIKNDGLPEFNNVTIEKCIAAIGKQTTQFENGIRSIEASIENNVDKKGLYNNVLNSLEHMAAPLDTTWGLAKTLYLGHRNLMPTKCYLTIHERAKRARATKFNSPAIYNLFKSEYNDKSKKMEEDQRVLKKYITEGKLNGLELNKEKRAQLTEVTSKLASECTKFRSKVETATKQFNHTIQDGGTVRDFPQSLLSLMAVEETKPLKGPWKVTLHPHIYSNFMQYCPDSELRYNLWQANVKRASGYFDKALENSTHIEEIRFLRKEQAALLGYETFADMSMETKMAGSVANIKNTLNKLLDRAFPAHLQEMESLTEFAAERGFEGNLNHWDIEYWKRKQRKTLFNFDEDQIREYFPLPKVLNGLFDLSERLFNIVIKERSDIKAWHKDVKFFDIFEPHSSAPVAGFYLDLYCRKDEKIRADDNNGWMVSIRNHSFVSDTKPLAAIIFNFSQPKNDRPSLLTFTEVKQLFHKFGFGLQHLLTRTKYSDVAGLSNVEWDAVEICGHVMTNWLYEPKILQNISAHYESEDPLPKSTIDNLLSLRQHMAGQELCKQLYLSTLDLELYSTKTFWLDIVKELYPQYFVLPLEKQDSHPCSFTDIFSGEWPAAYYSKIWSKMIAADIYGAFHEVRNNDKQLLEVGKRFRDTYLSLGGSCHPSEVFRRFRGRDPSHKAILAMLGLRNQKKEANVKAIVN